MKELQKPSALPLETKHVTFFSVFFFLLRYFQTFKIPSRPNKIIVRNCLFSRKTSSGKKFLESFKLYVNPGAHDTGE